jgi:hypothetical protein
MAKYLYVDVHRISTELLSRKTFVGCYSSLFSQGRRVAVGMGSQDGFIACGTIWDRYRIWRRSSIRDCEYALMPLFNNPNWDEDFGQDAKINPFGYAVPQSGGWATYGIPNYFAIPSPSLPFGYHGRWSMLSVADAKFLIDCGIEID